MAAVGGDALVSEEEIARHVKRRPTRRSRGGAVRGLGVAVSAATGSTSASAGTAIMDAATAVLDGLEGEDDRSRRWG